MDNSTALRPSVLDIRSFNKPEAEEVIKGTTAEEKNLHALTTLPGWKIMTDFVETVLRELDEKNASVIAAGGSFEEIGKNTIVISLTKDILHRIFAKVEDAKDAVENSEAK